MKRGTPEHPKMLLLASTLEINNYAAVGLMECLWHFTARYAPQGNIGKYTDEIIAHKIGWEWRCGTINSSVTRMRLAGSSEWTPTLST